MLSLVFELFLLHKLRTGYMILARLGMSEGGEGLSRSGAISRIRVFLLFAQAMDGAMTVGPTRSKRGRERACMVSAFRAC